MRGVGTTTALISNAPLNSYWVSAHHSSMVHDRFLAKSLGRYDLKFITVASLISTRLYRGQTTKFTFDHYTFEYIEQQTDSFKEDFNFVYVDIQTRGLI